MSGNHKKHRKSAQGMGEYIIIITSIALAVIGSVKLYNRQVNKQYSDMTKALAGENSKTKETEYYEDVEKDEIDLEKLTPPPAIPEPKKELPEPDPLPPAPPTPTPTPETPPAPPEYDVSYETEFTTSYINNRYLGYKGRNGFFEVSFDAANLQENSQLYINDKLVGSIKPGENTFSLKGDNYLDKNGNKMEIRSEGSVSEASPAAISNLDIGGVVYTS